MHTSNGLCNPKISALLFLFHAGCTLEVYNQSTQGCGNGVTDVRAQIPETCDDGPNNGTLGDPCSATCQTANGITITGVADPYYLISGTQVASTAHAVLKMTFEDRTPGTNAALCAGTIEDFAQRRCSKSLSDSGGPGYRFLTIIDANTLTGEVLYVIRQIGTVPAEFVLTIE